MFVDCENLYPSAGRTQVSSKGGNSPIMEMYSIRFNWTIIFIQCHVLSSFSVFAGQKITIGTV